MGSRLLDTLDVPYWTKVDKRSVVVPDSVPDRELYPFQPNFHKSYTFCKKSLTPMTLTRKTKQCKLAINWQCWIGIAIKMKSRIRIQISIKTMERDHFHFKCAVWFGLLIPCIIKKMKKELFNIFRKICKRFCGQPCLDMFLEALVVMESFLTRGAHHLQTLNILFNI